MQKSLGLIETQGLAGGIEAADAAVKSANVELIGYELTRGGGWTTVKIQGDVGAVKAAVDAARIAAGKVSLNHRECLKADRPVSEGDTLTCRGLGKCIIKEVPGQSKKGRTMLVIERYL